MARLGVSDPTRNGGDVRCKLAPENDALEPQLYEHVHELTGDFDVLFIGMECDGAPLSWVYGALLIKPLARKLDQARRLDGSNCEKGLHLVNSLKPQQVYVYAMGQEPWLTFLTNIQYTGESRPIVESNSLVKDCLARGRVSERLFGSKEILLESHEKTRRAQMNFY